MLETWTPVIAAAVLAFTPALQAPAEPDFSGDWKLVSSAPSGATAPLSMTVEQPITRADVYGKPMKPFYRELLVTRDFGNGPRTERHGLGGIGGRIGPSGRSEFRVGWESRTLVIEHANHAGPIPGAGEWDERREEWSFDADGHLRIVITTRTSQNPTPSSVTHVYQRR